MTQDVLETKASAAKAHPSYPERSPKPSISTYDSLKSQASYLRAAIYRRRYLLTALALTVIVIMMISIVFAAHAYYHQFGGQGWLKVRIQHKYDGDEPPRSFLPSRKVPVWIESTDQEESMLSYLPWNARDYIPGPGYNVPFHTCGDQKNSCEPFDQPDICCPVGTTCYKSQYTNSGILCCNATSTGACAFTHQNPPQCLAGLVECSKETGGGCCPSKMECSPNGCVHVKSPYTLSETTTNPSTATMASSSAGLIGTPVTITNTITVVPQATVTLAKSGEVANTTSSRAEKTLVMTLYLPYTLGCAVLGVATFMGML